MTDIPTSHVHWQPGHRIVSSRFPTVSLFDEIADPADFDALYELEGMTNPRLRQELGRIDLVPAQRRISGAGTTPIMAAFTHLGPDGSRFSDGSYGVYYCALERDTAIAETVYHRQRFLAHTNEAACILEMRCYLADVDATLHDVRGAYPALHDPDSYAASQQAARQLRTQADSEGIVFDSVRQPQGQCAALFYPDLVAPARQGPHLYYHWNGTAISHIVVAGEVIVASHWRRPA